MEMVVLFSIFDEEKTLKRNSGYGGSILHEKNTFKVLFYWG